MKHFDEMVTLVRSLLLMQSTDELIDLLVDTYQQKLGEYDGSKYYELRVQFNAVHRELLSRGYSYYQSGNTIIACLYPPAMSAYTHYCYPGW